MRTLLPALFCLLLFQSSWSQELYFPPLTGTTWETMPPEDLGWCDETVNDLINFLDEKNSKSFIVLKDGKIVLEEYFDEFTADSLWYWASAGKSLMATMIGLAQEDGLLDINDPVSDYLGQNWTSAPAEKEALIKIWHQITMTSGLDEDGDGLDNCLDPSCLDYLVDAGTRWFYYNSPYRLSQDVMEEATGQNKSVYTRQRLGDRIGMKGFWFNYVFYSNARDMARFGLLSLNEGSWDDDIVMTDKDYFNDMVTPSQDLNQSYGYLWWLNGQPSYKLPALNLVFQGQLIPDAPADMYAAMGKDEQRIYIIPSMNMVVVRQGEAAGALFAGPSSFDNLLWEKLMNMSCITDVDEVAEQSVQIEVFPNPSTDYFSIRSSHQIVEIRILDLKGSLIKRFAGNSQFNHDNLTLKASGAYLVQVITEIGVETVKLVKH